jgi:hypothetical protein
VAETPATRGDEEPRFGRPGPDGSGPEQRSDGVRVTLPDDR